MRAIRVVAALIAHPEDRSRFLVQQRLANVSRPLLWEFPGGKVEPGESDQQALAREGREELAVELDVGERVWSTVHAYEDLTVELVLYRACIASGALQRLHANDLAFLTPKEMKAKPFCEADLPLLDFLSKHA
ncbi:MAG: (deoxy)nucleoside triphosphate pyrophosphohydrolase [Myxococcota bacterium]